MPHMKKLTGSRTARLPFCPAHSGSLIILAILGRHDEAIEMFERLLSVRNDLGLLSEEYDPGQKRLLGNFPQAFSHVGLVNSACNLVTQDGPATDQKKN